MRVAGPGETLPLATLTGAGTLITNARTMGELRAVAMPSQAFRQLCNDAPEIGMCVYQAIAETLGDRYRTTLGRLAGTMTEALRQSDAFANV